MAGKAGRIILRTLAFIGLCGILTLACLYLDFREYARSPGIREPSREVIVEVAPGQGFTEISKTLHRAGMITEPAKFVYYARIRGYDKQVKAGEYRLSSAMSPEDILQLMIAGKVTLHRLTIPEGKSIRQIAELAYPDDPKMKTAFIKAATDPSLVRRSGINADTFEGYLFPDTYYFPKQTPPAKIISVLFRRFQAVFREEWKTRALELGFTIHEVVTLASIIEKETGAPEERPVISSVFHNRLKRRMRLESDPTVIYGIKDYQGNITRRHLRQPTPYNTYLIKALPPGPIANPGMGAIHAALYPADTKYLYFVSKKKGVHHFSTNLKAHNRAVRKYQLGR